jgi:hypothetical protein
MAEQRPAVKLRLPKTFLASFFYIIGVSLKIFKISKTLKNIGRPVFRGVKSLKGVVVNKNGLSGL